MSSTNDLTSSISLLGKHIRYIQCKLVTCSIAQKFWLKDIFRENYAA